MLAVLLPRLFGACATRLAALCLHEGAHALTARLLGFPASVSISFGYSSTTSPGISAAL